MREVAHSYNFSGFLFFSLIWLRVEANFGAFLGGVERDEDNAISIYHHLEDIAYCCSSFLGKTDTRLHTLDPGPSLQPILPHAASKLKLKLTCINIGLPDKSGLSNYYCSRLLLFINLTW